MSDWMSIVGEMAKTGLGHKYKQKWRKTRIWAEEAARDEALRKAAAKRGANVASGVTRTHGSRARTKKRNFALISDERRREERDFVTTTETFDIGQLDAFMSDEALAPGLRTRLRNLKDSLDVKGSRIVHWARNELCIGRHSVVNGVPSIQSLRKDVRNAILRANYLDIDLVNAHPTLMLGVCRRENWPCEALARYVDDRDACLAEVSSDRDSAKRMFLMMLNGGNGASYASNDATCRYTTFAHQYAKEVSSLVDMLKATEPEFCKKVAQKSGGTANARVKLLSHYMQHIESGTTVVAVRYLQHRGFSVGTLIHDGFCVRKDVRVHDALMRELEAAVLVQTGLKVAFGFKSL